MLKEAGLECKFIFVSLYLLAIIDKSKLVKDGPNILGKIDLGKGFVDPRE